MRERAAASGNNEEDPSNASALRAAITQPAAPAASPLALMMRADLAAGRLTSREYVREARGAGVSLLEITATLKNHMNAQKDANDCSDAAAILPAGTYFGRTHSTPVKVVDGIFVPVRRIGPAAPGGEIGTAATSLAWLRDHCGAWGARAAERLGPDNDFMPDLSDESRGGRLPGGKIGPEATRHLAAALRDNAVVTSLMLGDNALGTQGAAHLASALEVNRTLTELDLSSNGLGDAGAAHLAAMLHGNAALTAIDLSDNDVTETMME
eukprot:CAMPEP_0119062510 /NCGR_PEP_ID=MMETSP1178-20130426/6082_1 /TAXON_ID=33656 /ORGANISM="unid sp, Strain CCMP2000" /LENGTH=267 /DNA_ID=CAMNT_0007043797 /DNA_START=23 /DNA_END=823 /DNA_ORIENTATION=+